MAINLRGKHPDTRLKRIASALEEYAATHPRAQVDVYRHNSVSVRVRIIDPTFKGQTRGNAKRNCGASWSGCRKTWSPRSVLSSS